MHLETSEGGTRFFKKRVPSRAHSTCPLLSVFWEVLKSVAGLVREHNSLSEGLCTFEGQKWRTGALWFWWPQAQSSDFKASQVQLLPGTSFCQLIVRINRKLVQVVRSVRAKRTQQVEQSWTMQQPLACQEAIGNMHGSVTILPAMGGAPWWMCLGTRRHHLGSSGEIDRACS